MPRVLITPAALLHAEGRHTEILKQAGFEVAFPDNPEFARGLCDETESINELRNADAVIAGSEHYTASLLDQLPRLRVIARNGVGYDRVDMAAATASNSFMTPHPFRMNFAFILSHLQRYTC